MNFIIDIYFQLTNFNFDPVAVNFGPIKITWYALSYIVGLLFAWRYALYISKVNYLLKEEVIDYFFNNAILGVIIGGRLGYVIFYNFNYYSENLLEILYIWQGGMSFHGGLIGVVVAQFFTSKRFKVNFFIITDISSLVVPFGFFLGRIANFINGELYGRVTDDPIGIIFPNGGPFPRHPSQLYEAFFEGIVLMLIFYYLVFFSKALKKPGIIFGSFLLGYGVIRFSIEFLREPDAFFITNENPYGYVVEFFPGIGMSMGQLLTVPMIIFGLLMILVVTKRSFDAN